MIAWIKRKLGAETVRWIGLQRHVEAARPSPVVARRLRASRRFFYAAYAADEAERIEPLLQAARAAGYLIWSERIDAEHAPMDLGATLRAARAVIVFCSAEACASRAIYKELVLAARNGKAILPVYLDDQLPPDQYLFYLSRHHGLRAHEADAAKHFLAALDALERGRRQWRDWQEPATPGPAVAQLPQAASAPTHAAA